MVLVAIFFIVGHSVFAAEPHQNPEDAETVFSGIALLRYCSGSLDYVLQKNPAVVEARLEKMPFANIPLSLERATGQFFTSATKISHLFTEMGDNLDMATVMKYWLGKGVAYIAPNLAVFNRVDEAIYGQNGVEIYWFEILYGFLYPIGIIAIAILVFRRRNFK